MSYDKALYERVQPAGGSRLAQLARAAEQAQTQVSRLAAMETERAAELVGLRAAGVVTAEAAAPELAAAAQARTLIAVYEEALGLLAHAKQEALMEQNWAENQLQSRLAGLAEAEAVDHASQAAGQRGGQGQERAPNAALSDSQQQLDWLWRQDTGQPYLIAARDGA